MLGIYYRYFIFLLHPIECHRQLQLRRENPIGIANIFPILPFRKGDVTVAFAPCSLLEGIILSWPWALVKTFYMLLGLYLGLKVTNSIMELDTMLPPLFFKLAPAGILKTVILGSLLEVIIFPLSAYILFKLIHLVIVFFCELFAKRYQREQVDEVVYCSMASYSFYLIPVLGEIAQKISLLIYLFCGLKYNLRFNNYQALLVLISPVLLLGLMLVLIVLVAGLFIQSFL